MDFGGVKLHLERVQILLEDMEKQGSSALVSDMVLGELRTIYSMIKFEEQPSDNGIAAAVVTPPIVEESLPDAQAEEASKEVATKEPSEPASEELAEEPVVEDTSLLDVEVIEPTAEPVVEPELVPAPVAETSEVSETVEEPVEGLVAEPELTMEQQLTEQVAEETKHVASPIAERSRGVEEQSLFGDDVIMPRRPTRRSVILSLYEEDGDRVATRFTENVHTSEVVEKKSPLEENVVAESEHKTVAAIDTTEVVPPQPAQIDDAVLGDVLRQDYQTLGDTISRPKGIAESAPISSLRSAIGINDRFLLIRDLFGGDEQEYEHAIVALDKCQTLEDCMIYILENYSWPTSSVGAKLIMGLIQRKFR